MRIKNLYLFSTVALLTGFFLFVGWIVVYFSGVAPQFIGGLVGGTIGVIIAIFVAERKDLFEGATFNAIGRFAFCGFLVGVLVGISNSFNDMLSLTVGVPGAGFGALLGKYLDRFFIDDPPPKIFG